jgi:hypothetical protein
MSAKREEQECAAALADKDVRAPSWSLVHNEVGLLHISRHSWSDVGKLRRLTSARQLS